MYVCLPTNMPWPNFVEFSSTPFPLSCSRLVVAVLPIVVKCLVCMESVFVVVAIARWLGFPHAPFGEKKASMGYRMRLLREGYYNISGDDYESVVLDKPLKALSKLSLIEQYPPRRCAFFPSFFFFGFVLFFGFPVVITWESLILAYSICLFLLLVSCFVSAALLNFSERSLILSTRHCSSSQTSREIR